MTLLVLQSMEEVQTARQVLNQRRLSSLAGGWQKALARFGLNRDPIVGDHIKSWDVLKTIEFLEARLDRNASILDIGAYASEIPSILHKLGFRNLAGVDLDSRLPNMPFSESIDFRVANFMQTPFRDAQFDAVTAISVIEHGFDGARLFSEVARLLKPGGFFVASFDYWPEKISTDGITMFGMDWRIFSRDDIVELIGRASAHGLEPLGPLSFDAVSKPISCAGKAYSFAWIALRKKA